ncbi:MAG TPA: class I tRNA ligase family protein, partial [Casimicrobiaceae bacterium]|nr:class I tRNA ligase family protein [Casimicrobiaceae bacterium]
MSEPRDRDDISPSDDVLGRADALLNRHRVAAKPAMDAGAIPTLTQPLARDLDESAIPTLTDIVTTPVRAPAAASAAHADNPAAEQPAQSGEIITRVQAQNLEHGVYQKLKQELDAQIADVLHSRFMPDVAGALDQALNKISSELKTNIDAMVRASIEQTLQKQLEPLRLTDAAPPAEPVEPPAPAIMPDFSAPPPPSPPPRMELAKSFEPHAIENYWYPRWESRGYFAHSNDTSRQPYCIQLPPPNVTGTLHMG